MTKENWGGTWTEEKLVTFQKYVAAYLKVVHGARKKYEGWPRKIIYFDGFAGSGSRVLASEENDFFFQRQNEVYRSSAERVLTLEGKFDEYIFVDVDEAAIEKLKSSLDEKGIDTSHCTFVVEDINIYIKKFISEMDSQKLALILLDPFGMQLKWESIEEFKKHPKGIDLWILVPSGIALNRLLDKKGEIESIEKLTEFFGLTKEEIRNEFYKEEKESTLFGEEKSKSKIENSIEKIVRLYIKQLKTIFHFVTEKPLELKNSKNLTIFHFVFASQNETAIKIASQIINKAK
ncbi:MAG: three-Cys-motif partner protein TcmP [Leptospiraceae bacterium]|nr:three-Cys-motif partner protein TcmP [Leptospiraceae bacterium]